MSTPIDITIQVSHRGLTYPITLPSDATLAVLRSSIEALTNVPLANQKLLYKGKKASHGDDTTLTDVGFKGGFKLQMIGNTEEELGGMRKVEDEQKRRERIMQERQAKGTVKVRSTGSSSSAALKYRFHRIEPLQHLPNPSSALSFLQRLASDPAIKHVMQTNQLEVGVLTELAPHEHPDLLGLNVNAGQAIKLRIRTNAYDGFRLYADVRKVLCHELSHNVWGDHDNNFKEMNSRLNREVLAYEQSASAGTHTLGGSYPVYDPSSASSELEREAAHVLGGSRVAPSANETAEDRRRKILNATMTRLRKEEEELEQSCGTAGPAREPGQESA